ncbi:hypothetical protein [Frigoribacterium sp. CG_9.8]|uniref:deoxynucleotide monophosphate kinase family protein n=1 Tax=Frigoribacterium sp. CG_9.8 TaxID=2787733 RepID=UPI0018C97C7D|nr:hypothetical protein [Frigoribacterium sp. CG_9.8]MBG6106561.1 hypothetical protein [Frigoribacterium sp. CG_9.8]
MTPQVIGLGGRLRSGKDEVADRLVNKYGFVKFGMSDPLHAAMMTLNPLIGIGVRMQEEMSTRLGFSRIRETQEIRYADLVGRVGYVEAKKEPEVRGLLQRFGTEVGRDLLGKDVWTDIAVRRMNAAVAEGHSVVLTGVRFQNEVTMFDRIVGASPITAWVDRPSIATNTDSHSSESGVSSDDFQVTIPNTGTLEDLYAYVDQRFGQSGPQVALSR